MIDTLIKTIETDDIDKVRELLKSDEFSVQNLESERVSALGYACVKGLDQSVELLLEHGCSANAIDPLTIAPPIVLAAQSGSIKSIQLLINHGADVNKADCERTTALHLACKHRFTDMVELLLKHDARPNVENKYIATPLSYLRVTADNQDQRIAKLLFNNGADVNYQDKNGMTLVMRAALFGKLPEFKFFATTQGANLDLKDNKGQTALDMAIEKENDDIIQFIKENVTLPRIHQAFQKNKTAITQQKKRRPSLKLKRRLPK